MNIETYNRSLPLLAAALSDQRGIRVEVGGDKAYTDGKTIHLPCLPLDADESLLGAARGYIDHESAHVLFSDFGVLERVTLTPIEKHFANAIEDVRIESLMSERFPGCAGNFRETARYVLLDKGTTATDPALAAVNYVLYRLREKACPELEGHGQVRVYP